MTKVGGGGEGREEEELVDSDKGWFREGGGVVNGW